MGGCCDLQVDVNGEEVFMVDKVNLLFSGCSLRNHSYLLKFVNEDNRDFVTTFSSSFFVGNSAVLVL